jgi:uncharacterized protein (TIGR03435 family)
MTNMRPILLAVFSYYLAQGQTFDAASIKPAAMPTMAGRGMTRMAGPSGGPGTNDPGRVHYPFINLKTLLMNAYDVKGFQISGPAWLDSERFDIQATMPPETTKEQFRIMLQNLLAERFGTKVHHETKELPMYSLVVGKGGPKMKEAAAAPQEAPKNDGEPAPSLPPSPPPGQLKFNADGFPNLPSLNGGRGGIFQIMMPNRARLIAQHQTMHDLATRLSDMLSRPVADMTELTAKYDFTLTYSPEGMNSGMMIGPAGLPPPPGGGGGGRVPIDAPEAETPPTIFAAVQAELGLKLEPKKGPVDLVVVDHMEKVPTEN